MQTLGLALACDTIRCAAEPDSSPASTESGSGEVAGDLVVDILLDSFETAWMGSPTTSTSVRAGVAPAPSRLAVGSPTPVHPMLIPSNRVALPSTSPGMTHSPSLPSKRPHDGDGPHDARSALSAARAPTPHGSLAVPSALAEKNTTTSSLTATAAAAAAAFPAHSAPVPAPAAAGARAAAGGDAGKDFASVFFSPIPLSYLNITRSGSVDSNATGGASLGSPADGILRPGSLLAAAQESEEWEQEQADAIKDRRTPVASCANLSQVAAEQQQGSWPKPPLSKSPDSPDSVLGADALALEQPRPTPHHLKASNAAPSGPASSSAAVPVERGSDSHHPSAGSQPRPSPTKHTAPLDPNGFHPIMSLPPASAPSSAKAASPSTPAQPSQPAAQPAPSQQTGLSIAAAAAATAVTQPPVVVPCMDEVLPAVAAPLPHMQQPTISIAASVRPPAPAPVPGTLRLVAGTAMIPHIDKVDKGGEDACCVCGAGLGAIGVADGVSGWADEGIDPAAYSRTLIRHTSDALARSAKPCGRGADPREVIRYAHHATVMAGSSTICVAVMQPSGKLQVANLGDSGVRIIRNGQIVFASAAQQHMFNMPFQLSHPSIIESPDDADSADVTAIDVVPGDIIVLATDGLYDNVFDEEIASICTHALASDGRGPGGGAGLEADARALAEAVAFTAHRYALDPHQRTPWSVAASETGMPWARFFTKGGGKMDDVTVVVAFVVEEGAGN